MSQSVLKESGRSNVQPFPSFTSLRSHHHQLLQARPDESSRKAFLSDVEDFVRRARATGAYLSEDQERDMTQTLLDYWSTVLNRSGRDEPVILLAEFDPDLAPVLDEAACPYLGLSAFQETNRRLFFGRGELIAEVLDKLTKSRFLAILGPSGSGKSSLILAGVLPVLAEGGQWRYFPPIVPGSRPLESMAMSAKPPSEDTTAWVSGESDKFRQNPSHLLDLVREPEGRPAAIVVDQFEELFTLCTDEEARLAFIGNLEYLVHAPGERSAVIVSMREDFATYVARLPELQRLFEAGQVRVGPLSAKELREAIEGPANQVGLKFESGIVDDLVNQVLGEPAALPLLQFALLRLWKARHRNHVMWNTYRALGGPRKALAASADATLESLQIEEQITAKRVLLRLVRPGESLEVTSSRERVSSLLKIEDPGRVERVIKKLVEASLLRLTKGTVPTDDQVEIAHEALIRNWPRLVEWLEEERVSMRQRLRLRAAAELWEAHGRDPGGLLGGTLLEEAERYSDLDRLEADFVLASRKAVQLATEEKEAVRQRELDQARLLAEGERKRAEEYRLWAEKQAKSARRLRVLVGGLTLAIVLGFLSAIIAVRQRDKAIQLSEASTYNWNMAINRLEKLQQKTAIIGNLEQATKGNIDDLYGLGNIAGIDISHAQGKVNWQAVAREGGISFGAVKATEGIQWVDPAFTTNWQEMKDAGVTRGAYHLFRFDQDPQQQAEHFASVVNLDHDDLPPILVLRPTSDTKVAVGIDSALVNRVRRWLKSVEMSTKRKPIIYTKAVFWNNHMTGKFGDYPLWIAQDGLSTPPSAKGWKKWTFWQYTNLGKVSGVDGAVGIDRFNGSREDLTVFIERSVLK